jgi:hypothetical protein
MASTNEPRCATELTMVRRHFGFLLEGHGYDLFLLRSARSQYGDCLFGMRSGSRPRFQFGGETGPYVAVAACTVPFSLDTPGGAKPPWISIEALDDFLSGRGAPWLGGSGFPNWDDRLQELSETTARLLPRIFEIFRDESSVQSWRVEYDVCVSNALDKLLGSNDA